jgi:hypothetical protein
MYSCCARLARWLTIFALTSALSPAQIGDEPAARAKILALEHAWNQAEAFGDIKALDSLFDNAMVYVDSDGSLMTKAQFLSHVKSAHLQQVVTQSMTVQLFDNIAVVTGTYQVSAFKDGKARISRGRFIDTWVYKGSNWVCVAAQATPTH